MNSIIVWVSVKGTNTSGWHARLSTRASIDSVTGLHGLDSQKASLMSDSYSDDFAYVKDEEYFKYDVADGDDNSVKSTKSLRGLAPQGYRAAASI
eukprot:3947421-Amphidinium_carterae.2